MGTLTAHVMIGLIRYSMLFQVLRIQSSFNLLLGCPWIHEANAIHEGRVISIQFDRDVITSFELAL